MRLSRDFTLQELTRTDTGLENAPGKPEVERLFYLVTYVLQPVRDRWGPLAVTSGYRSPRVNRCVGGAPSSQHLRGEAADVLPLEADIDTVFRWIVLSSSIRYAQMINETRGGSRWIHASLVGLGRPRQQSLVYDGTAYRRFVP